MKIIQVGLLACMAVVCSSAATIVDVSRLTTQVLNPGDTLIFQVSNLSLPGNINQVMFQFISESINPETDFEAELTSRNGAVSIAFPTVQAAKSLVTGAGYTGQVWSIRGTLELPDTFSSQLFQNTHATLILHNLGPATTLGLTGYTLPQDLTISLSSGSTNSGAVVNSALYAAPATLKASPATFTVAPESNSVAMMIIGVVLMCLFSKVLGRIHTVGSDSGICCKSSVCNPVQTSDTI